jgi:glycosyltransferase involved in cell wall biosynthesis
VSSLAARHGGPSRSVRALANAQAGGSDAVDLLAIEQNGGPPAPGVDTARLRLFPGNGPFRLGRSTALRDCLASTRYDCIHHHGLWLRSLHYAHQSAIHHGASLVISPRGMLSDWSYAHHRWRKALASRLVHPGALAGATGWHATSSAEADEIRRRGYRQPVCVAPNGVSVPTISELAAARSAWRHLIPAAAERPVALFFSRFHRKKRVRELIDLWLSAPRGDWLLAVIGVPEEYSVAELENHVRQAGATGRIVVFDGVDKPPPYALASLFLLPSHSENFGLTIAEALAAGVPALVTDGTPWERLADVGSGSCVSWERFGSTLGETLALGPGALAAAGERGRRWIARDFSWERTAARLRKFYDELGSSSHD